MEVDDATADAGEQIAEAECVNKCKAQTAARKNRRVSSRPAAILARKAQMESDKLTADEIKQLQEGRKKFLKVLKARVAALQKVSPDDLDVAVLATTLAQIGEHDASEAWLKVLEEQSEEAIEQSLEDPILAYELKQLITKSIDAGEGLENPMVKEAIKVLKEIEPDYIPPEDPRNPKAAIARMDFEEAREKRRRVAGRRRKTKKNKKSRRKTKRGSGDEPPPAQQPNPPDVEEPPNKRPKPNPRPAPPAAPVEQPDVEMGGRRKTKRFRRTTRR